MLFRSKLLQEPRLANLPRPTQDKRLAIRLFAPILQIFNRISLHFKYPFSCSQQYYIIIFGESQHEQLHSFGFFADEHHPEHGSFPHQLSLISLEIGIGNGNILDSLSAERGGGSTS